MKHLSDITFKGSNDNESQHEIEMSRVWEFMRESKRLLAKTGIESVTGLKTICCHKIVEFAG